MNLRHSKGSHVAMFKFRSFIFMCNFLLSSLNSFVKFFNVKYLFVSKTARFENDNLNAMHMTVLKSKSVHWNDDI